MPVDKTHEQQLVERLSEIDDAISLFNQEVDKGKEEWAWSLAMMAYNALNQICELLNVKRLESGTSPGLLRLQKRSELVENLMKTNE